MRYSTEHKAETRARILAAAGRLFRREGYGGAGIDGLTRTAGVSNGAFYGHFRTKGEAFRTALLDGLAELRAGIVELKAGQGRGWLRQFVAYYLGPQRTCDLGEACALPSLTPDVVRADRPTRRAYAAELDRIIDEVASGLAGAPARRDETAIALLALLAGGAMLARAVPDPARAERIARAVTRQALALAG